MTMIDVSGVSKMEMEFIKNTAEKADNNGTPIGYFPFRRVLKLLPLFIARVAFLFTLLGAMLNIDTASVYATLNIPDELEGSVLLAVVLISLSILTIECLLVCCVKGSLDYVDETGDFISMIRDANKFRPVVVGLLWTDLVFIFVLHFAGLIANLGYLDVFGLTYALRFIPVLVPLSHLCMLALLGQFVGELQKMMDENCKETKKSSGHDKV